MVITNVVVILLLMLVLWRQRKPKEAPPVKSLEPSLDVKVAVASAMADAGLNVEDYFPTYDLKHSGKLGEVFYHAASNLNIPVASLGDLHKILERNL